MIKTRPESICWLEKFGVVSSGEYLGNNWIIKLYFFYETFDKRYFARLRETGYDLSLFDVW